MFSIAAHHTTAISMGIIAGIPPVFVLAGGLLVYRTPTRWMQWVGAGVTLAGVAVVASAGDIERLLRLRLNDGDMLMVVAVVLYPGYTLGLRRRPEAAALGLFTVLAASAFITSLPMVAMEAWLSEFQAPTTRGWFVTVVAPVFTTLLVQLTFIRGVGIVGPGRAGVFMNLVPVFAAAYLGEDLRFCRGPALALVLGGIWLAERSAKAAPA